MSAFLRGVGLAVLALGCAAGQRVPPAAPSLGSPSDVVPPELGLVLRLDIARLRSALGTEALRELRKRTTDEQRDGTERFLTDVLERSNVVVLAARYEDDIVTDFVFAMEGSFRGLELRSYVADPPWQPAVDLGGDVRRYDRQSPKRRGDPARIYVRSTDLVVAVSEATIDSVEAVIERGAPASSLAPPERGVVSMAARFREPAGGAESLGAGFPLLGEILAPVRSLQAELDVGALGFVAQATLEFADSRTAETAKQALDAARTLIENGTNRLAVVARHSKLDAEGPYLTVRTELERDVFGSLVHEALP